MNERDVRLDGRVVLVTGAGRGIGRALALLLARYGARVIVNDLGANLAGEGQDAGPGEETVAAIKAAGGEAVLDEHSVAEPDGAAAMVETAIRNFGRIDGVVNNAGILRDAIFHKMEPGDWEAVIGVHLMGAFYVSRAAAAHFRQQGSGAFVHFTSTSGLIGNVGQANYAAAKLGIVALSKAVAVDMARYGVRSNCVAPFAWSRMIASIPTETSEQKARVERMQHMTPERIAPLVTCLLSDAAKEVSGQIFGVRGNEIFLFSPPRLERSVHRSDDWTPESIAEHALPALKSNFYPLDTSADLFSWDPI